MSVENFTLPSFAKINLHLRILGKRDDGFHELCTVFQTVSLKDFLTFSQHREIILKCSDDKIPTDERNLIVKAAVKLQKKYKVEKGAEIFLEKNIPAPGGLGGGSSNAAVALIGLSKLWQIETDIAGLEEIGKSLGADVPFFLHGGTAIGVGRGDSITPLEDFNENNLLIVTPNAAISTALAFARLNARHLTNNASKSILQICRDDAKTVDFAHSELVNDFEPTVFNMEPEIERAKRIVLKYGARQALLSGSGASVFATFENKEKLQKAFDRLKNEQSWRVFSAETVSRKEFLKSFNFGKI